LQDTLAVKIRTQNCGLELYFIARAPYFSTKEKRNHDLKFENVGADLDSLYALHSWHFDFDVLLLYNEFTMLPFMFDEQI